MAYVRGNSADYRPLGGLAGLPAWSCACAAVFRRPERWNVDDAYRGGHGPLKTEMSRYEDPLCDAYEDAARCRRSCP